MPATKMSRWPFRLIRRIFATKKVSAMVALTGGIIAALLGVLQLGQRLRETWNTREQVRVMQSVGDQFAENEDYPRAIAEYEKALALDMKNVEDYRRIVTAMREILELKMLVWVAEPAGQAEANTVFRPATIIGRWLFRSIRQIFVAQKVSAIVALTGGIIAALLGVLQLGQRLRETWNTREQVRIMQSVGDQFAETEDYPRAIAEYEKALALDRKNVEVYRRIVTAIREKLELKPPVWVAEPPGQAEVNAALARLYELRTIKSSLKNDKRLLREEALLLRLAQGKSDAALRVLAKAQKLYPHDPEILATFGFFLARNSDSPEDGVKGINLITRAVAAKPGEASYHYFLGQSLAKAGHDAEAIREYRRTSELATGRDIWSQRTHNFALNELFYIVRKSEQKESGIPTADLEMSLEERVQVLEYLLANYESRGPEIQYFLASLYRAQGNLEQANFAIRKSLPEDKTDWKYYRPRVELFVKILEEGQFDPVALKEARSLLERVAEEEKYEDILEIGPEKEGGHAYKIGLKTPATKSEDGVLVVSAFKDYPFGKAGVREGDRILEFAHQKTHTLREIWLRLIELTPGTDAALKIKRGEKILNLTVKIE